MRAVIVDDEPLARQRLERMLRAYPDVVVVASLGDPVEAAALLPTLDPDVVLLDVQMPRLGGLELAEALAGLGASIVFVTAHATYALPAFDLGAVDYLLKPFDADRLTQALRRAQHQRATRPPGRVVGRLAVREGARIVFVEIADLIAVVSAGNYVELHDDSRSWSYRSTLAAMEARLAAHHEFVRLHRTVLVRTSAIVAVEPLARGEYLVTLRNGATHLSARTQRAGLRRALGMLPP